MTSLPTSPTSQNNSYPRGFVLASTEAFSPPEGFIQGPLLPQLYVHPWLTTDAAMSERGEFVVILGLCVPTDGRAGGVRVSEQLLAKLEQSESRFLEALDTLSGRYAILFSRGSGVKVLTDATGLRSVFYAERGGVVASHAKLASLAAGTAPDPILMPFRFGYPGNRTPYRHVRILTPNTVYNVTRNRTARYAPMRVNANISADEAAEYFIESTTNAIRLAAEGRRAYLALTAGQDSRTLLGLAMMSGIDFETFTYGRGKDTRIDRLVAAEVARSFNVRHTIIDTRAPKPGLAARLDEANYRPHHRTAVEPLSEWVDGPDSIVMTAVLPEIGTYFYKGAEARGFEPPTSPDDMRALHWTFMGRGTQQSIESWGPGEYKTLANEAFEEFIWDSSYLAAAGLNKFDQFYWEHRIGTWYGPTLTERDFYGEAFIPFNSRALLSTMLSVPEQDRKSAAVLYRVMNMLNPNLTALPINPKSWP